MRLRREVKQLGLLALLLTFIGFMGDLTSFTQLGTYGLLITIILIIIFCVICYWMLSPVLVRNARGVTLLEAVRGAGLVDIENRNEIAHALPPSEVYESAKREIVITGASAYLTFQQGLEPIQQALADGKQVYVLLFHPESPDAEWYNQLDRQDIRSQIAGTVFIIKKEGLHQHPGFHIRFVRKAPPFRAVMIDGDLAQTGVNPQDHDGQIRVQPSTLYSTGRAGIVFHFRKLDDRYGAFDYFAGDLRKQWCRHGEEDPTLFA